MSLALGLPDSNGPAQEYIARARARFQALMPTESFDASCWETKGLAKTSTQRTQRPRFTHLGSETDPLPTVFSDVVKAWVVHGEGTPSRWKQRAEAARWVWAAISERLGNDARRLFTWRDLQLVDLQRAEQMMIDRKLAGSTIYKTASTMRDLARQVGRQGIAPPIAFRPVTPRNRDSSTHHIEDPEAAREGMLTPAALDALAYIFAHAESLADRIWSAVLALAVAAGLRINEVFTLPVNALNEVEREVRGPAGKVVRKRFARIRRNKAKSRRAGGEGRPSPESQWLTGSQAALARLAVERLLEVTAEAREVARRLEKSEGRWIWPEPHRPRWLRRDDLMRVLGAGRCMANGLLRQIGELEPTHMGPGLPSRHASIAALEDYMTARQPWDALTVVKAGPGGPAQLASESLLCLRRNETHAARATLPLIQAVSHAMLDKWLNGDPKHNLPSVFERFEKSHGVRLREGDGSLVRVNTHQGRHFWVTTALQAGATTIDVARWQGREHIGDIATYDHRSMADKVEMVKEAIRAGTLRGPVASIYVQLAEDVRDVWLEGQVQAAHVTPLGMCVHDFTASPCLYALNCLKSCPDYLVDPANPEQRVQLVQLRRRTRDVLERMRPQVEAGQIARSWVHEAEETLRGVERALGAMDAADRPGLVQPSLDGPSRFTPLFPARGD